MAARRVLVVEDDPAIRRGIVDALRFEGYEVLEAGVKEEGQRVAERTPVDLVLLDLVLPDGDGLDLLAAVRKSRPTLPVIILTARGQEEDRVKGLKLGADDYVVKPFSVRELLARVGAVLRRSAERPVGASRVEFPGGHFVVERRELSFDDGTRMDLSEREADALRYLGENPGRAISREELLDRVWHLPARGLQTRTVDMTMARLREKLRDDSAEPRVILTVRGKGYMFSQSGGTR
ncbi:DNA-binding response regulator, OmpR family, contains REC and winged-helix (wHTH) domain [Myxococcus fulvus]|uniref:DNA-binding response regulator n=1 Tax=Myxococcus fulvus TaxID=33 RepID=A0A511T2M6_MYXFU|nr:response regulator transcription factor [Myxococcus fulvus]AKF82806.1 ArsR family transcriptional regulator [Myxococcus fulvus 124B02]GEN08409.1 DNA-binding response regulator [Myxococcus fulvus]SEU20642.1 DNA-binding response regulator, OmpR family, contains REC and winged-helix (wHTH) domain [Myxococcus fulvus]